MANSIKLTDDNFHFVDSHWQPVLLELLPMAVIQTVPTKYSKKPCMVKSHHNCLTIVTSGLGLRSGLGLCNGYDSSHAEDCYQSTQRSQEVLQCWHDTVRQWYSCCIINKHYCSYKRNVTHSAFWHSSAWSHSSSIGYMESQVRHFSSG